MKNFYLICMSFICLNTNAVNIAITFDDFPMPNGALFTVKERAQKYVDAFTQHNAKAAFFCVGQHCKNRKDDSLVKLLLTNGQFVGNHSMSHPRLSASTLADFEKEIISNEELLSTFGKVQKWFLYPYLDYGDNAEIGGSQEKLMGALDVLTKLGYKEAYSTIKNFDWQINKRMQEALKKQKNVDFDKLKKLYLDFLKGWIQHYIDLYKTVTNKEIVHTINFQDNDLNAFCMADILEMVKQAGWNIVSPEIAFSDLSWRLEVQNNSELLANKCDSLNCDYIDKELFDFNRSIFLD
ncbi:MAG: polysaccharide deacetylase family protein [Candidatus Babeliales bacterium]|nr:polysaccharide deacetylase family protein [Candidatus Babeliales bacterium]